MGFSDRNSMKVIGKKLVNKSTIYRKYIHDGLIRLNQIESDNFTRYTTLCVLFLDVQIHYCTAVPDIYYLICIIPSKTFILFEKNVAYSIKIGILK